MNKTDKNYKSKQKLLLDFKHFLIKYRQQREWPYKRGTTEGVALQERDYRGSGLTREGLQREWPYKRGTTEGVALQERDNRGSGLTREGLLY
jgi:hypothetical protein